MATIKFLIQSKSSTAGIYVRLKEGRHIDVKAKTNFLINSEDWSPKKGCPKHTKSEHLKILAGKLSDFHSDLLNHYNGTPNKLEITTHWLKAFINPPEKLTSIPEKLVVYYDYYAECKDSEIGYTTKKKLRVQKNLLLKFQKETKTEYLIKDVDNTFKLKFEQFCRREGYAPNTISQVIKSIKTICYHAQKNGLPVSNQLTDIAVKWQKSEKIYLDISELEAIEKTVLFTDSLKNARDWLIISCETGQRISDFMRFTQNQIRTENGKTLLEFTQVKTKKIMTIPLGKRVIAILNSRNGAFPKKISDQKYNDYIKEVCKQAGLTKKIQGSIKNPETNRKLSGLFEKWELITSHIGRRSFATNNYGRVPTSLLIGATGHSTEKMFLEYIGKTDTQKALQLADYF